MSPFEKNILHIYGQEGQKWLDKLPALIAEIAATYGLSHLSAVKKLSHHYVLLGLQNEQPIMLKLGLDIQGLKQEASALMVFAEFGVPQLLAENHGWLLQKQVIPGLSLITYFPSKENEAIDIVAHIIRRLHKAPISDTLKFPHMKDWLTALNQNWLIPAHVLQKARQLRDNLLETSSKSILLHGDLHHENILQNNNEWLAIDPKGVMGEPAYEVAAFIRNPIPALLAHKNASTIIQHRVSRFAHLLELPPQRILDWCFVQAVLAWIWIIEDGGEETYFKNLTAFFERMISHN